MKTRNEKIKFLNGLLTGKRKISELLENEQRFSFFFKETTPEGMVQYEHQHTKKIFSEKEFQKLKAESNSFCICSEITNHPSLPSIAEQKKLLENE